MDQEKQRERLAREKTLKEEKAREKFQKQVAEPVLLDSSSEEEEEPEKSINFSTDDEEKERDGS